MCSKNKDVNYLCSYWTADLHVCFGIGKKQFSSGCGWYVTDIVIFFKDIGVFKQYRCRSD